MSDSLLNATPADLTRAAAAADVLPVAEAAAAYEATSGRPGQRPPFIPEKFWDPTTGTVRLEALAKSYQELERRMGGMVSLPGPDASPEDRVAFERARGVPDSPDAYDIAERHPLLKPDPDLNTRLHAAGFTPSQAQLVYDLAHERVLPVVEDLAAQFEADRQLVRLIDHFGGEERWAEVSRQVQAWGTANLGPDVLAALATTFEGVVALESMMRSGEPALGSGAAAGEQAPGEEDLKAMMRDPRYWREREPTFVARVGAGFRRLYPDQG